MGIIVVALTMAMLSICTLNVNGIHDPLKWKDLWNLLPHTDIICLQEMYLTAAQEYAFKLYAQSYDWFFSHSTSNSAGIVVAVHKCAGANTSVVGVIPGRLIALDIECSCSIRLVNIYAPNNGSLQKKFFHISPYVRDNMILLRDFNSVIDTADRKSGQLDSTSRELASLLASWYFLEVPGSHQQVFSYYHPSIPERKSQIDCIYTNIQNKSLCGYAVPCSLSDYYLIGLFTVPEVSLGPKQ